MWKMRTLSQQTPVRENARQQRSSAVDYWVLSAITVAISITAFIFYFRHGAILLYGDAVAHSNIARHVFDSRTPGILEFGTVWLPLPHLLDMPFVMNNWMWSSGLGASIPSMFAHVAGVLGIFRLVRGFATRSAAWIAALIYALNPNLLYMQATAMTETLYLALFIWAIVHFFEFAQTAATEPQRARRSLELSGIVLAAAMLVRYDGWFLGACSILALVAVLWRLQLRGLLVGEVCRSAVNFVLLTGLAAGLWLAYNHCAYGRALEFATGPYSARAIAERTRTNSFPTYPGEHSIRTAALYFLKVSKLNVAEGPLNSGLLGMAFACLLATIYFSRKHLPLALLWTPAVFYALSIAYGSVPIYFPEWWPYTYYNVRYGLQMLPAIAVFVALGYELLSRLVPARLIAVPIILLVAASYVSVWRSQPICLREAEANGTARFTFDTKLAEELRKLPQSATLMMYCGVHPGALQQAGIPFRRVLREGNHPEWEIGLTGPAKAADYAVAIPGDEVSLAVRLFPQNLRCVATVDTPDGGKASIYRSMH
jgi:hypothetical protein